jgi:hypothetical protein
MNQITDELLRRQRALLLSKRRKFVQRTRGLKTGGISGVSVNVIKAVSQSTPTNASPINFTVTFAQAVTGFTSADLVFTGSTVGGTLSGVVSGTGPAYNIAVTGMTGQGNVQLRIPASAAVDSATGLLPNSASNAAIVAYDSIAPSVTTALASGQADPATISPITFTITFSEVVTGFLASDVVITGTAGGTKVVSLSGSGPAYNAEVTGMTTSGTVIATVPVSAAADLAGNLSTVSNSTTSNWTADTTAPTVTINKGSGQGDPTSTTPILFDVVFSEAITGFTSADISFTGSTAGGTLAASISGTGPTYTVSVSGMTTDGNVVASIPAASVVDLAGNANLISTSTDNVVAWVAPVGGTDGQLDFSDATQSGLQTLVLLEDI